MKLDKKLDKRVEGHLATLLEGYENNLHQVIQFIEQTTQQLQGAKDNRKETEGNIAELKGMLQLQDETARETTESSE